MVSRPHLSLVPAHGLPRALRAPSRRAAAIAAGVVALAALVYLAARETGLFAIGEIEVRGAPAAVREAVREEVEPVLGESLVALDRDELRRRLEALPMVRSVTLDRAFPHTLRIVVAPERPLAVVRRGAEAWLVSERGRVIRPLQADELPGRARIWASAETRLAPGETVDDGEIRLALAALGRVPDDFPVRVQTARVEDGSVTLVLAEGAELRLGEPEALPLKLAVAARVLRAFTRAELVALAYLDVTVPVRPVAGDTLNSQVEPEPFAEMSLQISG